VIALLLACAHAAAPPASSALPPRPAAPSEVFVPSASYAAWLATLGIGRTDFHEEPRWRLGDWSFFTLDGPFLDRPAAVSPTGVAGRDAPQGWYALLAHPVEEVAPRVAWLLGNPVPLGPADPVVPGASIAAPTLTTTGDARVLTLWVGWPPAVNDPVRVRITARPDGTATLEETHWSEVK